MKIFVFSLLLVFAFSGWAVAGGQSAETVRVQINREKRAPRSGVSVRFVSLIEDSRCPVDVQCIQAGNARIRVRVMRNGRSQILELNTNGPSNAERFAGYEFKLAELTPQPRSNIRVARNGYVATITVMRIPR